MARAMDRETTNDSCRNFPSTSDGQTGGPSHDEVANVVLRIWSEVLGTDRMDMNADFLELGGSSLQAMQITSRLRRTFGKHITLHTFFKNPRIAAICSLLDIQHHDRGASQETAGIAKDEKTESQSSSD